MNDHIIQIPDSDDRREPGSTGHILAESESDRTALIERFIAAECNDSDHREIAAFLSSNPGLIRWVAHRVNENFETAQQLKMKPGWPKSAA